jgi:hypothetical protein
MQMGQQVRRCERHVATAGEATTPMPPGGMGTILERSVINSTPVRVLAVLAAVSAGGLGTSFLPSTAVAMAHMMASGLWLGVNIWTTFFAGITMFKNLERQTFGRLQAKLFPLCATKFFAICTFPVVWDPDQIPIGACS